MKKLAQSILERSNGIKELKNLLVPVGEKQAKPGAFFTNLNPDKETSLPMIQIYDLNPKEENNEDYKQLIELAWQEAKNEVYAAVQNEMPKAATYINEFEAAKNPGHWLYLVDSFTDRGTRRREEEERRQEFRERALDRLREREERAKRRDEKEQRKAIIESLRSYSVPGARSQINPNLRYKINSNAFKQLKRLDLETLEELSTLVKGESTYDQVSDFLVQAFKSLQRTANYEARLRAFAQKVKELDTRKISLRVALSEQQIEALEEVLKKVSDSLDHSNDKEALASEAIGEILIESQNMANGYTRI
jgi:hypothetical protein